MAPQRRHAQGRHMERLLLTLAIIFVSLGAGYACRRAAEAGTIPWGCSAMENARRKMQILAVYALIPFSAMLSLWGLPKPDPRLVALPVLGLAAWVLGGALALAAARQLRLDRPQTGSLYCCGTFTNIGAVGGLTSLLFLGENSIALVALYRLCEELYYFSISFPIARWYSPQNTETSLSFRAFRLDPVLCVILCALGAGFLLNLLEVPRPEFCGPLASGTMIAATTIFLFAIGLSLRLSRLSRHLAPSLAVCAIKFVAVPLVVISLAAAIGFGDMDGGLPLRVVAILAAMPVAMTALVPPTLFHLDVDLANACWIFSTLGLVAVLPLLMLLLPRL